MGLIAQEVEEVFPEWIDADPSGYKHLTVRGFEALTVEAVTFSSPVGPSHPAGLKEDAGAPSASSVPGRLKQAGMIRG